MRVGIDIETQSGPRPDPFFDKILLTSVVFDDGREETIFGECYPDWLLQLIQDAKVMKLAHNSSFEAKFWLGKFGIEAQNVWDTLAVERVLTSGKEIGSNDLQSVAQRRLGVYLDKSIRTNFSIGVVGPREIDYNLKDSRVLLKIQEQQERELEENGQRKAAELECDVSLIVADMEHNGIGFDLDLWESFLPIIAEKKAQESEKVWQLMRLPYQIAMFGGVSGGLSLSSHDKVVPKLHQMGIQVEDYQSGTLQDYLLRHPSCDVVRSLLEYKKWEKAQSWGYPKYLNPITNRMHVDWNPQGADTFRFTCSNPNLQQVARPFELNFRHLFRARSGYKFIGADFSQIELRILAEESQEPFYVNAFNNGEDLHAAVASVVTGKSVKKGDKDRELGKIINFGVLAYRGSYLVLIGTALDYGFIVPIKDAKRYVERIRQEYTQIEAWGEKQRHLMQERGYVDTPVGHRRYLYGEDRDTVARNTRIQMFAAGILKDAMVSAMHRAKRELSEAHYVLQVHDELVMEVKEEEAELGRKILTEEMVGAGGRWLKTIPTEVDSYISDTWEK